MADSSENHVLGALLGLAIGDALGAPARGLDRAEIVKQFGEIRGYRGAAPPGAEEIHPGEFTDETEFVLCIVESMTVNGGQFDPETAGVRLLHLAAGPSRRWMNAATREALDRAATTLDFAVPLSDDGLATGDVAARGVPIGLMHAVGRFDGDQLRRDVESVVRLTHGGPAAINAAAAVAFGIRLAATGVARERWARETAEFLGGGELAACLEEVDRLVLSGSTRSKITDETGTGLAAAEAIPAAFAASMVEPVFENAVFAAVSAGGAADTIGALTGALAGAANGASGIPQGLIDGLEGRIYISLAAPWFFRAARQRAGHLIDLRPVHGPRPELPPRM